MGRTPQLAPTQQILLRLLDSLTRCFLFYGVVVKIPKGREEKERKGRGWEGKRGKRREKKGREADLGAPERIP